MRPTSPFYANELFALLFRGRNERSGSTYRIAIAFALFSESYRRRHCIPSGFLSWLGVGGRTSAGWHKSPASQFFPRTAYLFFCRVHSVLQHLYYLRQAHWLSQMSTRPTRHLIDRALQRLIGKIRALFTCNMTCNNDILPIVAYCYFLEGTTFFSHSVCFHYGSSIAGTHWLVFERKIIFLY